MAGTLVPSAATVHLRPQRGDADASWTVGNSEREFIDQEERREKWINRFNSTFNTQLTDKILFGGVCSWCAGAWLNLL